MGAILEPVGLTDQREDTFSMEELQGTPRPS